MPREEAFLLFAPPEPPVRLEPGAEIVLGRSRACELTLRSEQASRRHAVVERRGDDAVLRDLGSTNGTFVNGERVEGERTLAAGDRIEIGNTAVTFCRVEGSADAPVTEGGEAQTMIFEQPARPPAPQVLSGDLARIPMFAVLQVLEMGGQTGMLEVDGPDGIARLWLDAGRPVHAEAAKAEGLDAALELAQTARGHFTFAPGDTEGRASFEISVTELVLEASRLLDEAAAGD